MSDFLRIFSCSGIGIQLNRKFQSKPQTLADLALIHRYVNVSESRTSMIGVTTFDLFSAIRSSSGSIQPGKQTDYYQIKWIKFQLSLKWFEVKFLTIRGIKEYLKISMSHFKSRIRDYINFARSENLLMKHGYGFVSTCNMGITLFLLS